MICLYCVWRFLVFFFFFFHLTTHPVEDLQTTLIYWYVEFGRFVLIWGLLHKYGRSKMDDRCCPQNLWLQKSGFMIPVEI